MKNFLLILSLTCILLSSCKSKHVYKIEGKQIPITEQLETNKEIEAYIKPYRIQINKNLDSVICFAKDTYSKSDGFLNTAIGNMMADAVYEQSNPVFKSRTGKSIDFVLLNHGGIRSIISKGNVTTRTAYKVMPFDNAVIVVKMKGNKVKDLIDYLVTEKKAHPISGMTITLDANMKLQTVKIQGEAFDENKSYLVATSDYLYNGGDRMTFFKPNETTHQLNYKVRNVLIDYFTNKDTLAPTIDDRFIQITH